MSDTAEAQEVQVAPTEAIQPTSDGVRAAFAARTTPEPPTTSDGAPAEQPEAAATAAPAATGAAATPPADKEPVAVDYTPLAKEFGYETPEALRERLAAVKDFDPKAVDALKANQRDDYDKAVREMLADPAKARAYFDLQTLQPDALATGTPEQQRELLFENYKLSHPELTGRLAELGFNKEYAAKYSLKDSEDPEDAEDAEFAKLQYEADLKRAVPALKTAQESAKVAALPKPVEAEGPTPEETEKAVADWNKGVTAVLAQPIVQTVQVDGKPVNVAYDAKDAGLKEFLETPEEFLAKTLRQIAYPNGLDKPADMVALAGLYGRLMQPDAIATAAAEAARAAIGAHVSLSTLTNPAPDAPQSPGGTPGTLKQAIQAARPAQ